jgi:glycosyltransferase involved in cell wall biosynthesis
MNEQPNERGPETMIISVVLCTYNRCQSLQRALESAAALVLPESVEWEILVVDNNSNDQTRETVENFSSRYPGRFRYLFETQQGKSYALNTGIREARGDVLAFMDDDVTLDPDWLGNLTANLHTEQWAGAGGRILPKWTCSPPRWLSPESPHAAGPLVAFHPRLEAGQLHEPPIGTNMAFRKAMFEKYGGFRVDLGPAPGSEIRCEDTEFGRRLLVAGERMCYEPTALVYHPVPENRIKKQYFLAWWFDKARGDMRVNGVPPGTKFYVAGIPMYLIRRLTVWTLRWMVAVDPVRRFTCKLNAWGNAGEILECYHQSQLTGKRTKHCRV